jgi:hypothetical protein
MNVLIEIALFVLAGMCGIVTLLFFSMLFIDFTWGEIQEMWEKSFDPVFMSSLVMGISFAVFFGAWVFYEVAISGAGVGFILGGYLRRVAIERNKAYRLKKL